jgi:hypothetical protein
MDALFLKRRGTEAFITHASLHRCRTGIGTKGTLKLVIETLDLRNTLQIL